MNPEMLASGTAIVHSSGNNTSTHYNMQLAGETAMMTKERFIERYGVPLYTVRPRRLRRRDPAVPDRAEPSRRARRRCCRCSRYPDMVTQTIHVGDCELLEHYMDATDRTNAKWRVTKNRSWLVGMNAEEDAARQHASVTTRWPPLEVALGYSTAKGSTECVQVLARPDAAGDEPAVRPGARNSAALRSRRATSRPSAGRTTTTCATSTASTPRCGAPTWDNVGVQYGLKSLQEGKITPAEFVRPELQDRRLEAPERDGAGGLPVLRHHGRDPKALTIPATSTRGAAAT